LNEEERKTYVFLREKGLKLGGIGGGEERRGEGVVFA